MKKGSLKLFLHPKSPKSPSPKQKQKQIKHAVAGYKK